jgi:hypothetical protein
MPNIVIFSLDYDGCADILFKEQIERKHSNIEWTKERLLSIQKRFLDYLNILASIGEQVELYNGSLRQCDRINLLNMQRHKNGNCFENYELLCNSKTLHENKEWKFKNLLLGDTIDQVGFLPFYYVKNASFFDKDEVNRPSTFRSGKIGIIANQLTDTAKNHPNDTIDFYYMDDRDTELQLILDYFVLHKKDIPPNVNFILIHCDWTSKVLSTEIIATEKARIERRIPSKNEINPENIHHEKKQKVL